MSGVILKKSEPFENVDESINFDVPDIKAVSYTHLDVYKRQAFDKAGTKTLMANYCSNMKKI